MSCDICVEGTVLVESYEDDAGRVEADCPEGCQRPRRLNRAYLDGLLADAKAYANTHAWRAATRGTEREGRS